MKSYVKLRQRHWHECNKCRIFIKLTWIKVHCTKEINKQKRTCTLYYSITSKSVENALHLEVLLAAVASHLRCCAWIRGLGESSPIAKPLQISGVVERADDASPTRARRVCDVGWLERAAGSIGEGTGNLRWLQLNHRDCNRTRWARRRCHRIFCCQRKESTDGFQSDCRRCRRHHYV